MKKRTKILLIVLSIILLIVLFCPWLHCRYDDGGTDMYIATTYTLVFWNSLTIDNESGESGIYKATRIYWFPDNFRDISELYEIEKARDDFHDYLVGVGT